MIINYAEYYYKHHFMKKIVVTMSYNFRKATPSEIPQIDILQGNST
jgi:hypothetical protein